MSPQLLAVSYDARDPSGLARFWAALLGREIAEGASVPGDDTQLGLRFVERRPGEPGSEYLHLHLTSTSPAGQQHTVARALELGAGHLDVGQRPEEGHIVLADPEGNAFCVIEPGNTFLAGCGFLGEVACDGAREVGLFWSAALGWPLVWDHEEETAIQSPRGGTKVAWGGPPVKPREGRNRQCFDLTLPAHADRRAELERLVALGATHLDTGSDGAITLADPGGYEFRLLPPGELAIA